MPRIWVCAAVALGVSALAGGTARAAGEIGDVLDVLTGAYGQPPELEKRELFPAETVYADEVVETVPAGGLTVQFRDGSELTLGGDSRVVLDQFVYDPSQSADTIELGKGVFRFIGGDLGHGQGFQVTTPTAAIGVRGTDFVVVVQDDGATRVGTVSGLVTVMHADGSGGIDLLPGSYADVPVGAGGIQVGIAPARLGDPFALALWFGGDMFVALAGIEPAAGGTVPVPPVTECPNSAFGCDGVLPRSADPSTDRGAFQPASAPASSPGAAPSSPPGNNPPASPGYGGNDDDDDDDDNGHGNDNDHDDGGNPGNGGNGGGGGGNGNGGGNDDDHGGNDDDDDDNGHGHGGNGGGGGIITHD
jgi:hypothetical protein